MVINNIQLATKMYPTVIKLKKWQDIDDFGKIVLPICHTFLDVANHGIRLVWYNMPL